MEAQATKNPIKTYTNKINTILVAQIDDWDKIHRIINVVPPADNPNAVLIHQLSLRGRVPKPAPGSDPVAVTLAKAMAQETLDQIKEILNDLQNLNLYTFAYQFDAHYYRHKGSNFGERKITRFEITEEFPTKTQARELAKPWLKNLPDSIYEADSKIPFELTNIVSYCVTVGCYGNFVDYENYITKEKAGVLVPDPQQPNGARSVGKFDE